MLPLDTTPRPSLAAGQTTLAHSGPLSGVPASAAPNILNKSSTIAAEVEIPDDGAEGMIVTEGGRFGGYGLFLGKGDLGVGRSKPVFLYNLLDLKPTIWVGTELDPGTAGRDPSPPGACGDRVRQIGSSSGVRGRASRLHHRQRRLDD